MNELAASLIIIYFTEALFIQRGKPEDVTQEVYDTAKFCLDLEYVEADIFTVFNCMMEIG